MTEWKNCWNCGGKGCNICNGQGGFTIVRIIETKWGYLVTAISVIALIYLFVIARV